MSEHPGQETVETRHKSKRLVKGSLVRMIGQTHF